VYVEGHVEYFEKNVFRDNGVTTLEYGEKIRVIKQGNRNILEGMISGTKAVIVGPVFYEGCADIIDEGDSVLDDALVKMKVIDEDGDELA
jgi:hypothetical protein